LGITPPALSGGLLRIQRAVLSFPSTYQMLPRYADCCAFSEKGDNSDAVDVDDILDPSLWSKFSWLPDEFKTGRGAAFVATQLLETKNLRELLRKPIEGASGNLLKSYFIANGLLKTWSRVYFSPKTGQISGHADMEGDGTVLLESATNGNPGDVKVSNRSHQYLFFGDEPKLMLEAILSNRIWHSKDSDQKAIVDGRGIPIPIVSVSTSLSPTILIPGDKGTITVTLFAKGGLQSADLSNVSVAVDGKAAVAEPGIAETDSDRSTKRTLTFSYLAPSEEGSYSIAISIPGINELQEAILVSTLN
jgi:hypothetical protein